MKNHNKLYIGTILVVYLILYNWGTIYKNGCFIIIYPLIVLLVISSSFISIKMQERICYKNCYFKETSFFSKVLASKIMVTVFYLITSVFLTISVMYSAIDYSIELWLYIVLHIILIIYIFKLINKLLADTIHDKLLYIFSRELTIKISATLLAIVYIYILLNSYEPSYVKDTIEGTIKAASKSIYSNCEYIDYILRLKIELDSSFWWFTSESAKNAENQDSKAAIWFAFIFINTLSVIGINRFIVQIVYWLDAKFNIKKEDDEKQ